MPGSYDGRMGAPLRLMFFDRTCRGKGLLPGLTAAWTAGGILYGALRRLDDWRGVSTWLEGLDFLLDRSEGHTIAEIQYWGHGEYGCAWVEEDKLDITCLAPEHPVHARLVALKARLAPDALWWFRTCGTFGTQVGHNFARAWTRFLGCRAAGHTYAINFLQSGLRVLSPEAEPTWSINEGYAPNLPMPTGKPSSVLAPRTITCLHGAVPRS